MKNMWWEKLNNAIGYVFSDLYGVKKVADEQPDYISVNKSTYIDVISEDTLILEPKDTFDKGIVGYRPKEKKLVYALSLLISAVVEDKDWEYEEAVEWLHYNTIRACQYGEYAPIILEDTFVDE